MKRTSKTIMAFLTAMTMTAGATLSVSAVTTSEDSDSIVVVDNGVDNAIVRYDLNNEAYIEKVNSYAGTIEMEKEFVEYLNSVRPKEIAFSDDGENFTYFPVPIAKHVYKATENFISSDGVSIVVESANSKNERTFQFGEFYFEDHMFRNNDELVSKYTVDEMNEFLRTEGFKAHMTEVTDDNGKKYYTTQYDDRSEENVFGTFLALNKKYGAVVSAFGLVTEEEYFKDELLDVSILGDVNNDGKVDARDCAYIVKLIANRDGDSLPDNADYNKDGKKNVRDAAAISKDLAAK